MGPPSSTGSPITFRMRPSVFSPTGTLMPAPVSMASWPRNEPLGGVHGDAANGVLTQVLRDLHHQVPLLIVDRLVGDLDGVVDRRQGAVGKLHVDHGPQDLSNLAHVHSVFILR